MNSKKCDGSGRELPAGTPPLSVQTCPHCGRKVKTKWASGGYDGFASYAYMPRHNASKA